ncbi:hypothetical protein EG68_02840 [Paragonimus skrjabini miyazakii]|uniref:gamma-glutamylcyclotransferase n=1 Tax=Paragonimus skrjabini miyazakii TaxID=59628 RepID=A0A8S9Z3T7_9TREM|nr:hypothetical protein EG68_02840 [Paragonimus skrjabini miyazakii]
MIYYFAYGSNLLRQRIQLRNRSAVYVGVGCLTNYVLVFGGKSEYWGGATATIKPSLTDCVYGVVWTLDDEDIASLDAQEGVPNHYSPFSVSVSVGEKVFTCRTYALNTEQEGPPSPYYLDIVLRGAIQSNLPEFYVERLKQVHHNHTFGNNKVYSAVVSCLDPDERRAFQVIELRDNFSHIENE